MKFQFTIRGLLVMTTFASALLALGLWVAHSPILTLISLYLLFYFGILLGLYLFRYRQQLRDARSAWRHHKSRLVELNADIANKQATSVAQTSGD